LLQSNNFSNSNWDNYLGAGGSITGGQLGYDGSNDAWLIEKEATTYRRIQQSVSASGVWTMSVYAKAGTANIFRLRDNTSNNMVQFDLSTGVAINAGSNTPIDFGMEDVGNGWYRCYWSHSASISWMQIYVGWAESDSVNIYIQDAQLEAGLVATDYIETGASTAQAGILEDMPRLDYSGGASCPALLLEPQRRNLIDNSEYFNVWQKGGTQTIVANATTSPQGLQNASSLQMDSGYVYRQVSSLSISSGDKYVWSCYVNSSSQKLTFGGGTPSGTDVYSSEDVGDGWYRQVLTRTFTASGGAIQPMFSATQSGTDLFYIWGAQLEQGSYPTSYIPTYGASVTRSRDQADNQSLNPVLGNGNISVMYDFVYDVVGREGSGQIFLLYSNNNSLGIKGTQFTDRRLQLFSYGDFTGTIGFNEDVPYQTRHKVVFRVTGEVVELFYNGVKQSATISGAALGGVYNWSRIKLDPTNAFLAGLNQLAVFPTALTDSECIALTTL
jgi:hypothetical protein